MIGLSCLQTTIFKAANSLNDGDPNASFLKKIGEATKNQIAKSIKIPVLIGGNTLVTGENAYHFISDEISEKDWIRLCLLYTSPSPRDQRGSRMPSSA